MAVDEPLEKLLEELDGARRRLDTRTLLIREALDELPHAESVKLENYLGFGRSLRLTDTVRDALRLAAEEEIKDMREEIEYIRQKVLARRMALSDIPEG